MKLDRIRVALFSRLATTSRSILLGGFLLFGLSSVAEANYIGDFVWNDLNTNGVQDVGEPGLPGVVVSLWSAADSNFVESVASDANGFYAISNQAPGNYFVTFNVLGYLYTSNNVGGDPNLDSDADPANPFYSTDPFTFDGSTAITNIDAGFYQMFPGISLTKLASDGVQTAADGTPLYVTNDTIVTYTYIITNSGNTYLSTIGLTDDVLFPSDPVVLLECPEVMAPGDVITYTTQTVINASVTNLAEVFAFPVDFKTCEQLFGLDPVVDDDDAVVLLVFPGYDITKTVDSPTGRPAAVGENIDFLITIVNTGDVDLVTVPVVDFYDTNFLSFVSAVPASDDVDDDGVINWADIGPIPVGGSNTILATFTAVASTIGGRETNVVVTTPETPPEFPPVPPKTNEVPYDIRDPNFTITKVTIAPTNDPVIVGQTIEFSLIVTNTGDVDIPSLSLDDVYDTTYLTYLSSVPPSDDNNNDGLIEWANIGPIPAGATTNVIASFLAIANTAGSDETNVVVATPNMPPELPPLPPKTNEVPYEIVDPPSLDLLKTFIDATEPDALGNFVVTYTVAIENNGGAGTIYDLTDTPDPDPNVDILGGVVTGHVAGILVGAGPYNIVTNEFIGAGVTHVYTIRLDAVLSPGVVTGGVQVGQCVALQQGFEAGNGLYNEAVVVYGTNDVRIIDEDCGEIPPWLTLEKNFLFTTDADAFGNFDVTYVIQVSNLGGTDENYDLVDTPNPDPNVLILGGDVSGQASLVLTGDGPYTLASNVLITAGATHSYTMRLDAVLSAQVLTGSTTVSRCSAEPAGPLAGEGLFNEAVVTFGDSNRSITNDACGDVPPFLVIVKDFVSVTEADSNGVFIVTYDVTVSNPGGSGTTYDLSDTPNFDSNVTPLSNNVSGHVTLALPGPGPYTLATGESIGAGASHTYTLAIYAQLGLDVLNGSESVTQCEIVEGDLVPGTGLYNEATAIYGRSQTTIRDDACGEVPPVLVIEKLFATASAPDLDGNFIVTYSVTVQNTGGSTTIYDLTDTPSFDANVTPLSNNVSGHVTLSLPGAGPYVLATNESIDAGVTHTYDLAIHAQLSIAVLNGETNVSLCASVTAPSQAGQGLYNEATVVYGTNDLVISDDDCGDVPPVLVLNKDFVSASEPGTDGRFIVTYAITVQNTGGSGTTYDLSDSPAFDPNVTPLSNNVSGHVTLALPGAGPYTLATGEAIGAGVVHVYTQAIHAVLATGVLNGSNTVTNCEEENGQFTSGRGLFNEATVIYGPSQTTLNDDACGEVPPVLVLNKDFVSASEADTNGNFVVTYTITVENTGGLPGSYDLTDNPSFDGNVTPLSNNVSGQVTLNLPGSGPYTLATGEAIAAGATHTYTLMIHAQLSVDVLNGETSVSLCEEEGGGFTPGSGLFNEATVIYGANQTTLRDDACGEVPPLLVINKTFVQADDPDVAGQFRILYTVTVQNTGGSATSYDLVDTPTFDPNVTPLSNNVSGQVALNIPGAGPYTLATGEAIAAGATHTYSLEVFAQLSPAIVGGQTNASACVSDQTGFLSGSGLYNLAEVTYGTNNTQISDDDCGEVPSYLVINKDFVSATEPAPSGLFTVTYTINVQNTGGSTGSYDLQDSPVFDANVTPLSNNVSGHVVLALPGAGPYVLATGESIAAGSNHVYTLTVYAQLSLAVLGGDVVLTNCEGQGDDFTSGRGLYNEAVVTFGENRNVVTNEACGEVPPLLFLDKDFVSVEGPNVFGEIIATYEIAVYNAGGSAGLYDLVDTPAPDVNVTFTNGAVTGHVSLPLSGGGPYNIVLGESIGVGVTHVYTVALNGVLSADLMLGSVTATTCGVQLALPGEALFNEAVVTYTNITVRDSDCGDIPQVPRQDIGDTVWIDLNGDGSPTNENLAVQGLNNVLVELYRVIGGVTNPVDTRLTVTDAGQRGYYIFTNLPAYGVYLVAVNVPSVLAIAPNLNVNTTPLSYLVPTNAPSFLTADFGFRPGTPTAVDLVSFEADVQGDLVVLMWETATEINNLGFHLYRAESPDAERIRITGDVVPGRGTGEGGEYQYADPSSLASGTYYYWLEDVEYDGSTREHGPLRVTVGDAGQKVVFATAQVDADGVVMITAATLQRSGIAVATVDPARLRVLVDGEEVAVYVSSYGSMFQSYDYVLVYLDNPEQETRTISLAYSGAGEPMRMGYRFVFLSDTEGATWTGRVPEGAAQFRYSLAEAYARCLITGFSDSLIWLLDITKQTEPVILVGSDVLTVNGEVGLYYSDPETSAADVIAIEAGAIEALEQLIPVE